MDVFNYIDKDKNQIITREELSNSYNQNLSDNGSTLGTEPETTTEQ